MRLIDADALELEYRTMPLANVPDIYAGECDDTVSRPDLLRIFEQSYIERDRQWYCGDTERRADD